MSMVVAITNVSYLTFVFVLVDARNIVLSVESLPQAVVTTVTLSVRIADTRCFISVSLLACCVCLL